MTAKTTVSHYTLVSHEYRQENGKAEPIAHARVCQRPGGLWLTDVWTHADHRNEGRAGALLTALLADLGERDMYLEIAPYTDAPMDADALAAFYGRYGFQATGVPGVLRRNPALVAYLTERDDER
jgi:GNAT superfamily N-acetyltransferase